MRSDHAFPGDDAQERRQRAEAALPKRDLPEASALPEQEFHKLFHELQVHQIELEMQNEELRHIQQELDAAKTRYFDLFDLAPVGYLTLNQDGLILESNLASATLLGLTRAALTGKPMTQFILKEDQDTFYLYRNQLFESRKTQTCELHMRVEGGDPTWVRLEANAVFDEDGSPQCFVAMIDIHDRKQRNQSLRTHAEELENTNLELNRARSAALNMMEDAVLAKQGLELTQFALDHSETSLFRIGKDASIKYVNDTACQKLGYTNDELVNLSVYDIDPDLTKGRWEAHWNEMREKKALQFEGHHRNKDGEIFPVEVHASFIQRDGEESIFAFANDITERKRTAEQIADLARFPAENYNPVFRSSKQGRLMYRNQACDQLEPSLGGATEGKWLPETWRKLISEALSKSEMVNTELEIEDSFFAATLVPVPERGYVNVYARNITRRQRALEKVKENEARLRRAQQVAQVGDWEFDLPNNIVTASDEAKRIYGLGEDQWTIAGVQKIPLRRYRGMLNRALKELVKDGKPYDVEFTIKRASDGALIDIHSVAEYDPEKNTVFGVIQDVTERKQAERSLARSEAKYRELFEQSADAFLIIKEGRYVDCNQAAVDMLRCEGKSQLLNTRPSDLSPERQPDGSLSQDKAEEILHRMEKGKTLRFEWTHKRADGELFPVEVSLTAITDSEGSHIIHTTWRDITESKRMQEAIEKRILALTQPMDSDEEMALESLFNIDDIQRLQDEFSAATGVSSAIIRPDGTLITKPSNSTRLCLEIIRGTEKGCFNCYTSDAALGRVSPKGPLVQPCLSGGLWDAGASIVVGGRHIASWLIGQVRDETQTEEQMLAYAREIGADETAFMEAFREVPTMKREQFDNVAQALYTLANQLSTTAYQNIQQARFITAEKKAQDALRESEERFKSLHNASFGGILIHHQGIIVECNLGLSIMTGYSQEELVGMNGLLLIDEDSRELVGDNILSGFESPYETTGLRKNGETYPLRVEARKITYKGIHARTVEFRDITEQKNAEKELRRLSTAIEQSPEAILITDTEGHIQYVNPAFEAHTGYLAEEVLGRNPRLLKCEQHPPCFYEDLWKTIASGNIWEGRICNKRKDGTLFTEETSISPVLDEEGQIVNYVAVQRDITQELVKEEELQQAHKMEAIGQLAGGVAHDFNNILQGILGFSEMLRLELDETSMAYDNANEIVKAAKRAAKLTQQLLAFSRKQPVQLSKMDLNNVVYDSESLLHMLLGRKHELVLDLSDELPSVYADQSQMTQIILNLSMNARDAMPNGGRLSISTESVLMDDADAAYIPGARKGHFACLAVTDTGCGMSAEIRSRIFDPFFTTKEIGTGTGLGLAVIYGIVEQNKGWINVYSEVGKGSCFKIYLPVGVSPDYKTEDSQAHGSIIRNTRILVVEDDPEIRSMVREVLGSADYVVVVAPNAEEGLALFNQEEDGFDLLMSDMELPGMRGDELAEILRSSNPTLPVLLFSGYRDQINRWKHIVEKGYPFINKPFTIPVLLDTVKNILKD